VIAIVSDDYGLTIDGIRYESPGLAATAASGVESIDGWKYWWLVRDYKSAVEMAPNSQTTDNQDDH